MIRFPTEEPAIPVVKKLALTIALACWFAAPSVYASEEANHAIVSQLLAKPVPELPGSGAKRFETWLNESHAAK